MTSALAGRKYSHRRPDSRALKLERFPVTRARVPPGFKLGRSPKASLPGSRHVRGRPEQVTTSKYRTPAIAATSLPSHEMPRLSRIGRALREGSISCFSTVAGYTSRWAPCAQPISRIERVCSSLRARHGLERERISIGRAQVVHGRRPGWRCSNWRAQSPARGWSRATHTPNSSRCLYGRKSQDADRFPEYVQGARTHRASSVTGHLP